MSTCSLLADRSVADPDTYSKSDGSSGSRGGGDGGGGDGSGRVTL